MKKHIPVSIPFLGRTEDSYVNDAMKKGAISGFFGEYIPRFERSFSTYCGTKYGITV